jgi:ABC-2 type transport system permease protein
MTATEPQPGRFVPHTPPPGPDAPRARGLSWFGGVGVIIGLELRQRVRGVSFYVLLGLFVVLMLLVSVPLGILGGSDDAFGGGGSYYSAIIYFVLLLGTLIVPALSGNAVNGDRDAGTLATTQVTLVGAGQIIIGKFVAAWITAMAFLVVSIPFLLVAFASGDLSARTIVVSLVVLAVELAVVAAVGVGLSAILTRPLFSVTVTYLVIAALSIGTPIAFALGGVVARTPVTQTYISLDYSEENVDPETGDVVNSVCLPPVTSTYDMPRFDLFWGVLAANPYVVLADASAGDFDANGQARDLFSGFASGVRSAQIPPEREVVVNDCASPGSEGYADDNPTPEEIFERTVPSWFVGLGLHILLGAGLLVWGIARTRTPAHRLPRGSRIA